MNRDVPADERDLLIKDHLAPCRAGLKHGHQWYAANIVQSNLPTANQFPQLRMVGQLLLELCLAWDGEPLVDEDARSKAVLPWIEEKSFVLLVGGRLILVGEFPPTAGVELHP